VKACLPFFIFTFFSQRGDLMTQIGSSFEESDPTFSQCEISRSTGSIRQDIPQHIEQEMVRSDYQLVFDSCGVGMAVTSMSGMFVDCNQLFCHISGYSKKEMCTMTLFSLTAKKDLERAFDEVSTLILSSADETAAKRSIISPITIQGSMKTEKNTQRLPKGFCVTLVSQNWNPSDDSPVFPVSFVEY
jgi:PAS domain S-box-containing protein